MGIAFHEWIHSKVRQQPSFSLLHATYFLTLASIGTLVLLLSPQNRSTSPPRFTLVDALYTSISALTNTGLMCVSMESLSYSDKVLLLLLSILGSQMLISYAPLLVRRVKYKRILSQMNESHPPHHQTSFNNDGIDNNECNYHEKLLEYNAMSLLSYMLVAYFLGIQTIGFLSMQELLRLHCWQSGGEVVGGRARTSLTFFAYFSTIAAFSNSGLSLLDDSMVAFRKCNGVLLTHSVLMLLGNTMLAPFLRLLIWVVYHLSRLCSLKFGQRNWLFSCDYLLKQPRRCYTHLFPQRETMWLVGITLGVSGLQILLLCSLQWNSEAMFGSGLNSSHKVINVTFQSIATRTTGENVINLPQVATSLRLLYLLLMYFSIYPIFLSRQHTNVLKEGDHKISSQALQLLWRDSSFLFMALLVICFFENHHLSTDPSNFSVFNMVFETISAYGNVGLSMGYDCKAIAISRKCKQVSYSLSGKWTKASKLVLLIVMLLGRQRGLPKNIDLALQMDYLATTSQDDQNLEENKSKSLFQAPSTMYISSPIICYSQDNNKCRKSLCISPLQTPSSCISTTPTHISTPSTISYNCSSTNSIAIPNGSHVFHSNQRTPFQM